MNSTRFPSASEALTQVSRIHAARDHLRLVREATEKAGFPTTKLDHALRALELDSKAVTEIATALSAREFWSFSAEARDETASR